MQFTKLVPATAALEGLLAHAQSQLLLVLADGVQACTTALLVDIIGAYCEPGIVYFLKFAYLRTSAHAFYEVFGP
jgi:hypothetical protein